MNLSKSQIFFRVINAWFLFSGFLYANLFFHAGDRYPVNILSSYFFLIVVPLLFLILGFVGKIRRKPTAFSLYQKMMEKLAKVFRSLSEQLDTRLLKSEFYLNGILFSAGCFFSLVLKMILNDIYFGWSFPISFSPEFLRFITQIFSWPWSWIWEGASPTVDLITSTEFLDLNNDFYFEKIKSTRDIIGIGDWRAFFIASFLIYGILPRFVLWAIHYSQRKKV